MSEVFSIEGSLDLPEDDVDRPSACDSSEEEEVSKLYEHAMFLHRLM